MSGIIMGALGGLGAGAQTVAQNLQASAMQDQQYKQQRDLMTMQSDLALEKEKAAAQFKAQLDQDMANQARSTMANNIANAKQGLLDQKMRDKYGDYDAAASGEINSGTPLTPAQQKVIDESKGSVQVQKDTDLKKLADDPETYIAAAISSGYIDPAKVADMAQQQANMQRQREMQQAGFTHDTTMESSRQKFSAGQQARAQAFQASESEKHREMEQRKITSMYGEPGSISDEEKKNWVYMYITGNGVPRNAPKSVANNVGTWAAQMGITQDDIAKGRAQYKFDQASAVTAGHRGGSMAVVKEALPALAENAIDAAKAVGNGSFVPMNELMMYSKDKLFSHPELATLKVAHQGLVSEYAQVIGRGGTNVFALKESMDALNSARDLNSYIAGANQVIKEMQILSKASDNVRGKLGGSHTSGNNGGTGSTVPNPVAANSSGVLTYDPASGTFR